MNVEEQLRLEQQTKILRRAKEFFEETIAKSHVRNTKKLKNLREFNVNPFLIRYLANFLTGNDDPVSLAKALVYPRALGTSINTSFGHHLQHFCSSVLQGYGSAIPGMDIEFIDATDQRKKYCQIKSGPNTINKDDVKTIKDKFITVYRLARTNHLDIRPSDLVIGVMYGTQQELSSHYLKLQKDYVVLVGQEFWYRLTGSPNFYVRLIECFAEVALDIDGKELLDSVIDDLAEQIRTAGIL